MGNALAAGAWQGDESGDTSSAGMISATGLTRLTETERHIVHAWFSGGEAVQVDPWWDTITNGRHRLWLTRQYFHGQPVPIRGDALGYANPADAQELGERWSRTFVDNVRELDLCEWFDSGDPVNVRFHASLVEASEGRFPSPV